MKKFEYQKFTGFINQRNENQPKCEHKNFITMMNLDFHDFLNKIGNEGWEIITYSETFYEDNPHLENTLVMWYDILCKREII